MFLRKQADEFIIIVIILSCIIFVDYATEIIFNDKYYYQNHAWANLLGWLLAAFVMHVVNVKADGDDYMKKNPNIKDLSLFGIHRKYWPRILVVAAFIISTLKLFF